MTVRFLLLTVDFLDPQGYQGPRGPRGDQGQQGVEGKNGPPGILPGPLKWQARWTGPQLLTILWCEVALSRQC
jgi:hypothetical protein